MVNRTRNFDQDILSQIHKEKYQNFNTLATKLKISPNKLKERLRFMVEQEILKEHNDPKGELCKEPNSKYYEIINDNESRPLALIKTYRDLFNHFIIQIDELSHKLEKERMYKFVKVTKLKPYGTSTSSKRNKKVEPIFNNFCSLINSMLAKSQGLVYAKLVESIPKKYHGKLDDIHRNLISQISKAIKRVIQSQKFKEHQTLLEQEFRFKISGYQEFINVKLYLKRPDVKWV